MASSPSTAPAATPAAVLFDLDGTLWDSLPGIVRSLAHTLGELGVAVPPEAELRPHVGPPLAEMLLDCGVAEADLADGIDIYRDRDRYRRLGEFECEVFPGAAALLGSLREAGVTLATATSKSVEPTRRMLSHFGLEGFFDVVAAAPMLVRGHSKGDVISDALTQMGDVPRSEIVMVGDRSFDVAGGREHGLRTVGVLWGYGSRAELEGAGADLVVASFAELGEHLGL